MARQKDVRLTMYDGTYVYVPAEEFNLGGIPESPESVIGNYIKGSRGPLLRVNTAADMSGEELHVNPQAIVAMKIIYP